MTTSPSMSRTLRLATAGSTPRCSERTEQALRDCDDVAALAALAFEHKVAPWLAAAIASNPALAADPRFDAVRAAGARQTMDTLALFVELRTVLRLIGERDIRAVVLKGPVIAETYYPEPGLRPYGDIDLLIRQADLAAVAALLGERGYHEKNEDAADAHRLHECHGLFQRIFIHEDNTRVIELHCDHLQIGLEPVGMETIWASSTPVRIGSQTARALEAHDLFVQLCVHLQRHNFGRLIWFKDLDLIIRGGTLDWDMVEARAKEQGCADSVAYTLWLLRRTLATPLPPGAERLAARQPWLSRRLDLLLWRPANIVNLVPQRQWRLRRLVQFAPESGVLRGGLPSLLTTGRRADKLRVIGAVLTGRRVEADAAPHSHSRP